MSVAIPAALDRLVPGAPTHAANGRTVSHSFAYDLAGRRISTTHDGAVLTYAYDAAGRLLSQTHAGANAVGYQYDHAGNVTRLTYPDAWVAGFVYDALNRVTRACETVDGAACASAPSSGATALLASIAYDALSRRHSVSYRNGTSVAYAFTPRGDLTDLDIARPGATLVAGYDMTYDPAGQVLSETLNGPDAALFKYLPPVSTDAYAPNGLNQLLAAAQRAECIEPATICAVTPGRRADGRARPQAVRFFAPAPR